MRFTDLFVKRPVLAIVVSLVILIAGLQSIRALSVRQYPRSDMAVVRVSTAYVGANADLVRGFITTPLERVIASADGIDYMESSSAQGLSTITVHLKLNYDTNAALTQIQAKVAQVRNDLPPEAEAPIIELETADNQFAAVYLSFSSADLDQNQITDYLMRVVQPKLSAISGVQRADILGNRTFAMRIWLKPDKMAALGISPSALREALARNNYLSALGRTKGSMVSVNLVANTDLRTPEEFRQLVVKEEGGVIVRLGEVADVVLGAENYEQDVRFNGETATFMGVWVLPTANSLDVVRKVREAMPDIEAQVPAGMKVGIPYDSTEYIQDAIDEVLRTLTETLLIVIVVIFLFLGSVRAVIIPDRRDSDFAGRRCLPDACRRLHHQSADVARDRAFRRSGRRRRDRHGRKRRAAHSQRQSAYRAAIDAARELVGPIIAMTITLAAVYAPVGIQGGLDGSAVPRIRVHACRSGNRVRHGCVDAVANDGIEAAARRRHRNAASPAGSTADLKACGDVYTRMLAGTLRCRPVVLVLWLIVAALMVPFYMFTQRELAPAEDQGVVFSYHPGIGELHDRSNQTVHRAGARRVSIVSGNGQHLSVHVSDGRLRRHGDKTMERAEENRTGPAARIDGPLSQHSWNSRDPANAGAIARRRRFPGRPCHCIAWRAAATCRARRAAGAEGVRERNVHLRGCGSEVRSAAGRSRLRSRQASFARRGSEPGRPGSFDLARRKLRQSLQHSGPELQSDSAGQAHGATDAGSAFADVRHGIRTTSWSRYRRSPACGRPPSPAS